MTDQTHMKSSADHESARPRRVLAVASAGGHWLQLMRLRPVLEKHDVTYVTTMPGLAEQYDAAPACLIRDASRREPLRLLAMILQLIRVVVRLRPEIVVSTGAAPGLMALYLGKILGARTIWIDSIANAEEMSMSGRLARHGADLWLTQWPGLAQDGGPQFRGAVL